MVSDSDTRAIALFFLFAFMEEKVALQAAHKAVASLKSRTASGAKVGRDDLIEVLRKQFDQHRKLAPRNQTSAPPETAWRIPAGLDTVAWSKFQKEAGENEIIAVTLSRILGFTDEDIAGGLGISLGSARYRIGKGMRQLGLILKRPRGA